MKKVFKKAALAALGLSLVAGSAQAVVLGVYNGPDSDVNEGPAYLANEANNSTPIAPADFAPGLAVAGAIGRIMVTIGVNSPTQLELAMDNASFTAATVGNYYLYPWDDANNNGIVDAGELTNAAEGSTGNSVVGNLVAGDLTFVGPLAHEGGGLMAAGTRLILGDAAVANPALAPTGGVHWITDTGLDNGSTITMTITESNVAGDETDTAAAGVFMDQYVLCTDSVDGTGIFDGIIDLTTTPVPKDSFNVADGNGATVANDDSLYVLNDRNAIVTNDATVFLCGDSTDYTARYFLTQAAGGGSVNDLNAVLNSSEADQALSGAAGSMEVAVGAVALPGAVATYTAGTGWVDPATSDVIAGSLAITWEATVDGSAINVRTFDASVVSVPLAGFAEITYELATGISDGVWTLGEGYDGLITYFPIGYSGYNAFLKVTNRYSEDATMVLVADCQDSTGAQIDATGDLAKIPAGAHVTYSTSDVVGALGLDADAAYQCAIEIVSDAPASLLQASGIQIGPDGRTDLPLYNIAQSNLVQ